MRVDSEPGEEKKRVRAGEFVRHRGEMRMLGFLKMCLGSDGLGAGRD